MSGLIEPVPVTLLDGPHSILFGNRAMLALEDCGVDLEKVGDRRAMNILLWAGLLHEDRTRTLEDVIDIVPSRPAEYAAVAKAVTGAIQLARGSETEDTPKGKPEATA